MAIPPWLASSYCPAGPSWPDPDFERFNIQGIRDSYDLRTNKHFTQKQSPITRKDFDEFVECYKPGAIHKRKPTWSEENPDGRWRCYTNDEIQKRDKLSLDLLWIKDESLTDTDSLPAPDIIATEIADELEAAFGLFSKIAAKLPKSGSK